MTLDKFTIKAQETVQQAVNLAQQNGQQGIEPVHLMLALIDKARDVVGFVFQKLGVNMGQVQMLCQQDLHKERTLLCFHLRHICDEVVFNLQITLIRCR